jgi:hypothetical protein
MPASPAWAYVGPGVDVGFIQAFLQLLAMVGAAALTFLTWPIYALIRRIRATRNKPPIELANEQPQVQPSEGTPSTP